jgi:hypothetical protein
MGQRVCVRSAKAKLQRLKPHSFCGVYVVAEATTHKHSRVSTQTLNTRSLRRRKGAHRRENTVISYYGIYLYYNILLSGIWAVSSTFPRVDGQFPGVQLIRKQLRLPPPGLGYSLFREVPLNVRQNPETTLGWVQTPL